MGKQKELGLFNLKRRKLWGLDSSILGTKVDNHQMFLGENHA